MSIELTQYQKYCNLCEDKGIYNPYKTEADYNRAYGILEEEAVPLVLRSKHRSSIDDHARVVNQIRDARAKKKRETRVETIKKPKAVKPPKIKVVKPPKEPKPPKPPKVTKPRANFKAMTPEEQRVHTNMLYAIRMKKKREAQGITGRFLMSSLSAEEQEEHKRLQRKKQREAYKLKHCNREKTPEQMQRKREVSNAWYAKNREECRIKRNEYLAKNPEARAKKNEAVRKWEEKNREHRLEYAREWAKKKRAKNKRKKVKEEEVNNTSILPVMSLSA